MDRISSSIRRRHSLTSRLPSPPDWSLSVDDLEFEDDIHGDYTCPFCYMDFDVASLCAHLEEEHMYECKSAVCPICAAKVGKDIVGHISRQHGQVFKMRRRRRSRRFSNSPNSTLSLLGKELPGGVHLQTLLNGTRTTSTSITAADPLLSSFICNVPIPEPEDAPKVKVSNHEAPMKSASPKLQHKSSYEASLTAEEREQKYKEDVSRSKFTQQLLLSTIFNED